MRRRRLFWQLYPATLLIALVCAGRRRAGRHLFLAAVLSRPHRRDLDRGPGWLKTSSSPCWPPGSMPRSTPCARRWANGPPRVDGHPCPTARSVGDSLRIAAANGQPWPTARSDRRPGGRQGRFPRYSQTVAGDAALCGGARPPRRPDAGRGAGGRAAGGHRQRPRGHAHCISSSPACWSPCCWRRSA